MKIRKAKPIDPNTFQFIILPNTGIQICRNFPLDREAAKNPKLFDVAAKYARKHQEDEVVQLLNHHAAVNRNIQTATSWIPCDRGEFVFFRVTNAQAQIGLDLLIDTNNGAGRMMHNRIHCVIRDSILNMAKRIVLASFYVEEHSEAAGLRGSLIVDFGNTACVAVFASGAKSPFGDQPIPLHEPFDPQTDARSPDECTIQSSTFTMLRVPREETLSPWAVMGPRAGELVQLEPLATSIFAPKKYVRRWPEHLKSLEPAAAFRGVVGQRDGLTAMQYFVRMSIEHLLSNAIARMVNPNFKHSEPQCYPIIDRVMLTYPLTWRKSDKELFRQLFKDAIETRLIRDHQINAEVEVELICSEPVAVAAYLIWESMFQFGDDLRLMASTLGQMQGQDHLRLLIVDLGGGSTDIAVVEIGWRHGDHAAVEVTFNMIESMRFNRAGDRLTHLIVTALRVFIGDKYGITQSLDYTDDAAEHGFHLSHRRSAVSKLYDLAEDAKKHLAAHATPWLLSATDEFALLQHFEPLIEQGLQESSVAREPHFSLDHNTFAKWVRKDHQRIETAGEPGFMDIFLFLAELKESLEERERAPHLTVLSGRTARLDLIRELTAEHIDMPLHRVRPLWELLPLTVMREGQSSPEKLSVVHGAHRFRFGDHVRFNTSGEQRIFNRAIGTVRETPEGLRLNEILIEPGSEPPRTVSVTVPPSADLRIGHSFRKEGIAEVIGILSNPSPDNAEEVMIDLIDDFTIKLNRANQVRLIEWTPGSEIILDNFNDNGRIDHEPKDFIRTKVIGGVTCW